jgi:dethiobiotin synthase
MQNQKRQNYFITGTDTDVGKSIAAAWCMLHLDAEYWKPTQSGLKPPTDMQTVQQITQFSHHRFHPETYRLRQPLSPHEAAKRDGVKIDMSAFQVPETQRSLVIEGAGGLMVPLNRNNLVIDLIVQLAFPTILVCRSGLGTINHTLLSLEAMRKRNIDIKGVIINGPKMPHNREAIEEYGEVPVIVEIDQLEALSKDALLAIKPEIDL